MYVDVWSRTLFGNVLMPSDPVTRNNHRQFGRFQFDDPIIPTIPEGLAIMLVYFAVTAVLGLLLFERKEFN